jgi:carbamoyl-phosphate synthase small subunit
VSPVRPAGQGSTVAGDVEGSGAPQWRDGLLVLADGTVFEGEVLVAGGPGAGPARGEVVFNTVMAGYQEVLTDPSYAGQIISFTYPHIGNYGVAPDDDESRRPFCRGVIVRELTGRPSNWRAVETLAAFLQRHGLWAMSGVDTRRLTRCLRDEGSMPGAFGPVDASPGSFDEAALLAAARAEAPTNGRDLVREVTCSAPYTYGAGRYRVVAYDFGIKRNILRNLASLASVTVVPATTPAAAVLEMEPDGIFLSNGPGDPAAVEGATATVRELLGKTPVFGICLGHQILARALGATTYKLPFGHHGGNHPVRRVASGTVEITSQNHNYAVAGGTFEGAVDITHVNLNDGVIEGFSCRDVPAFSVQYHPEAGPGPHDARYLFNEFAALMQRTGADPASAGSSQPGGGHHA